MQLNKELVREILLAIEADEATPQGWIDIEIDGHSAEKVAYHVLLLHEGGMLVAQDLSSMNDFDWRPKRLTFRGHEFLDTVRDREIWRRTKDAAEKAGGAGVSLLVELGKAMGKQVLKERLGIDLVWCFTRNA
ncbi:Uncharacterized protein AC509_2035 [Pseudomonas amygdali pv. morsprunorum]|uniref:DUF2513 domain-containing protein n=1 Tax=Pseudomonas amygdali TaxID=47877 RepID=UPI0006B8E5F6|nr:DUF2513 domain-containing protein [Pseudomonas amygdali]KPC37888.1 Uncharacterized protein AC509_2035 [Pseudomonas amygdali pv. morsprunorum]